MPCDTAIPLREFSRGPAAQRGASPRAWCAQLEAGGVLYFPQTPRSDSGRRSRVSPRAAADRQPPAQKHRLQAGSRPAQRRRSQSFDAERVRTVARHHAALLGQRRQISWRSFSRRISGDGGSTMRATGRSKKKGRDLPCAGATTCCIRTPFPRGPRVAGAFCASFTTFIPRERAIGWWAIHFRMWSVTLRREARHAAAGQAPARAPERAGANATGLASWFRNGSARPTTNS